MRYPRGSRRRLLLLSGARFPNTTSRRAVQVVSGSGERSVATGTTAASRDQNTRRTIYRLSFSLNFPVRSSYPVLDHGQGQVGGIL